MHEGEGKKVLKKKKSKKYADNTKDAIMMHIYIGQNRICLEMIAQAFANF